MPGGLAIQCAALRLVGPDCIPLLSAGALINYRVELKAVFEEGQLSGQCAKRILVDVVGQP